MDSAKEQLPSSHCQLISPAHPCAAEDGQSLSTLPLAKVRDLPARPYSPQLLQTEVALALTYSSLSHPQVWGSELGPE